MFRCGRFFTDVVTAFVFGMSVGLLVFAPLPPRRVAHPSGPVEASRLAHPLLKGKLTDAPADTARHTRGTSSPTIRHARPPLD